MYAKAIPASPIPASQYLIAPVRIAMSDSRSPATIVPA
jgi:hypothetical protein